MNSKKTAVFGIYASVVHAEQAVGHLTQAGFPSIDISVLVPDQQVQGPLPLRRRRRLRKERQPASPPAG